MCGTFGFISLGFLADAIGRKPTAMLWYTMSLVLTPLVYLWGANWGFAPLLVLVGIFGFFTLGIWAWAPVWLPELFPTRMRGTAVAFCFNAPRFISCLGPLIAGTLIAYFGGFGPAISGPRQEMNRGALKQNATAVPRIRVGNSSGNHLSLIHI